MKNFKKSGFTLIEALVAISILMIAIVSPMQLAQKGLSTASLSKDQMVAAFLAQGVIESVKNIRDEIAIRGVGGTNGDWLNGTLLNDCICHDNTDCNFNDPINLRFCTIDMTSPVWKISPDSIYTGNTNAAKLRIRYNVAVDGTKTFLKYDYNTLPSCATFTGPGQCGEDTKYTIYTNIRKTGNLDGNEAEVRTLVFWDSPLGKQEMPLSDFIYNYSENL